MVSYLVHIVKFKKMWNLQLTININLLNTFIELKMYEGHSASKERFDLPQNIVPPLSPV